MFCSNPSLKQARLRGFKEPRSGSARGAALAARAGHRSGQRGTPPARSTRPAPARLQKPRERRGIIPKGLCCGAPFAGNLRQHRSQPAARSCTCGSAHREIRITRSSQEGFYGGNQGLARNLAGLGLEQAQSSVNTNLAAAELAEELTLSCH